MSSSQPQSQPSFQYFLQLTSVFPFSPRKDKIQIQLNSLEILSPEFWNVPGFYQVK